MCKEKTGYDKPPYMVIEYAPYGVRTFFSELKVITNQAISVCVNTLVVHIKHIVVRISIIRHYYQNEKQYLAYTSDYTIFGKHMYAGVFTCWM